uniref:HMA domain-containing protein n=1 Tax=Leersia perrieri TaxID=77586 RepID=A0A0D9XK29_9ORYZ
MGEEKKDKSGAAKDGAGGDKKKDAGGEKAAGPIVLKVELHCAGCASKVKKAVKRASGVETVTTDTAGNKVVVTGPADAAELKERIEARTKKPVQIVSAGAGPPPKKEKEKEEEEKKDKDKKGGEKKADKEKGSGGEKKAEKEKGGGGKKAEKEEKKPKEAKEETVTLKIRLHCEGCVDRIKRRISKIKGVKDVTVDAAKDLVKVTGTMDTAALPGYLKDKLSRPVEVVAPGKKDGGDKKDGAKDGGEKKDKKDASAAAGGEEKKDKDKSAAASASVAPAPLADAGMYQMPPQYGFNPYHGHHPAAGGYYGGAPPPNAAGFYHHAGAGAVPYQPYAYNVHAPQMFSDENPNACSVM